MSVPLFPTGRSSATPRGADIAVELRHLGSPFFLGEREDVFAEIAEDEKPAARAVERPGELGVRPSPFGVRPR